MHAIQPTGSTSSYHNNGASPCQPLFFAAATTTYILIAVQFEERDLVEALPGYEEYRNRVSTADDPPYLRYEENHTVTKESSLDIWVHHRILGTKLKEKTDKLRIERHVEYPEYSSQYDFIIRKLSK